MDLHLFVWRADSLYSPWRAEVAPLSAYNRDNGVFSVPTSAVVASSWAHTHAEAVKVGLDLLAACSG